MIKKINISNNKLIPAFIKDNKHKTIYFAAILLVAALICVFMLSNDDSLYKKPIARITHISETYSKQTNGANGTVEIMKKQKVTAVIKNGKYKNSIVHFKNQASYSQAIDMELKVGTEVFLKINKDNAGRITSVKLDDVKRDTYIGYTAILFIILILFVGRKKGFSSLATLTINTIIFSFIISLFIKGYDLIIITFIACILFTAISMFIVGGISKKTIAAVIGTILGTSISVLIFIVAVSAVHSNGMHYEKMEFLTHPPEKIFLSEIIIGTLGGIMDIAISISSSIYEINEKNPDIEMKKLVNSGKQIGQDIMGTMANTLVFAYLGGSIPMILLMFRNRFSINYVMNISISLELIRALAGSIGIVISIPITIYVSVLFVKNIRLRRDSL
ncbi:YibE/F family protein [Clostridium oryzae]|uniref:YibE/F-like protein n=1 Tax=Clostridium oryzae TaxID=1450648 RepID=A0A1V4IY02_9CLOT|nr:YibE/F family protein [Clostridium oryzae]OPJ64655.1 YibE/F-like protein [Clostridium oryzae]